MFTSFNGIYISSAFVPPYKKKDGSPGSSFATVTVLPRDGLLASPPSIDVQKMFVRVEDYDKYKDFPLFSLLIVRGDYRVSNRGGNPSWYDVSIELLDAAPQIIVVGRDASLQSTSLQSKVNQYEAASQGSAQKMSGSTPPVNQPSGMVIPNGKL